MNNCVISGVSSNLDCGAAHRQSSKEARERLQKCAAACSRVIIIRMSRFGFAGQKAKEGKWLVIGKVLIQDMGLFGWRELKI